MKSIPLILKPIHPTQEVIKEESPLFRCSNRNQLQKSSLQVSPEKGGGLVRQSTERLFNTSQKAANDTVSLKNSISIPKLVGYQSQTLSQGTNQQRLTTERPLSSSRFQTKQITSPNSKFDFVCTSEACFRIKQKLNSTAFGKNSKKPVAGGTDNLPHKDVDMNSNGLASASRMVVSPNMMIKKTKTAKELKVERQIKELFENDPLFQFRERLERNNSAQNLATNTNNYTNQRSHDKRSKEFGNGSQMNAIQSQDLHLKLLQDFNVPMHKYNSLTSEEQRENYLLEHMSLYMKNLMKQLEELQQTKRMNDQQRISEINKRFQNDKGLYAWLQVLTPHTSLHKKLRKALIEKFQSEDIDPKAKESKMPLGFIGELSLKSKQVLIDSTQALRSGAALSSFIEHTFDDFVETCLHEIEDEKISKTKRPSFWQFNKTTADTIKLINAKEVDKLKPMHQQMKKKKISRPGTASVATRGLHESQSQPQFGTTLGGGKRPQTGMPQQQQQQFLSPELKKYLLKKERQAKSKQLNWNDTYEKRFGEHKNEMRIRLADLSSTNSWNQVVLGSFIKLFTKKPKAVEPNLIEEYKNLDYEKVKRIVSSIPSLNECIDKEYFQSIIDKMNKKKIDHVETHISNQVITNYEKEKEKSKNARFGFLKRKADVKGVQIRKHDEELKKIKESQKRKEENIEMAKRFRVVLKGLDNGHAQLRSQKDHMELQRFHKPMKRGLPEPLELPTEQTEAFRNKVIYEYFRDCPDKPKFKHDEQAAYFLQTTTGGPIKEVKKEQVITQEQLARAALKITRAVKRWRLRRQIEKERSKQQELQAQQDKLNRDYKLAHQNTYKSSFFLTQSHKSGQESSHIASNVESHRQSMVQKQSILQQPLNGTISDPAMLSGHSEVINTSKVNKTEMRKESISIFDSESKKE